MPVNHHKIIPFYYQLNKDTRFNMKTDAITAAFFAIFAGAFYPFYSVMAVRLGMESSLLAVITAAPYLGQLFAVYWGHRSDQGQKLNYVVLSGIFSRLMVVFLAFTTKPKLYAVFVILHYLLASIGGPANTSLLQKIYPAQYRGQIMGLMQFIKGMVRVVVTYLAGIWLDKHGFTIIFIISGTFGILSSLYYSKIKEPIEEISYKRRFSLKNILKLLKEDKFLRLAILGFFIFDLGNVILAPIYPLVRVKSLDLNNLQIGCLSIFWISGWFATAPFWGRIIDHYSPLHVVLISVLLSICQPLFYFFQVHYYLLMLASFISGAAASSLETGWLNMMMELGGERSSQYSGIYYTMMGVRGIIGPLLGNILLQFLFIRYIFLAAIGIMILGLLPFRKLYLLQKDVYPKIVEVKRENKSFSGK